jgi:hypothetical protein
MHILTIALWRAQKANQQRNYKNTLVKFRIVAVATKQRRTAPQDISWKRYFMKHK